MNTMLDVQILFGRCKHGITWGVKNAMLGIVTMVPRGVFKRHTE